MNNQDLNIDDDFIKKLVSKTDEQKPAAGFTNRVMNSLPRSEEIKATQKVYNNWWFWIVIALAAAVLIFVIFTFDFASILKNYIDISGFKGIKNIDVIKSTILTFSHAFEKFEFTSVSLTIIFSILLLFLIDKILKKWGGLKARFA